MAAKPTETVVVNVRMREKTRRQLKAEADKEGHSLNKEIARRLERSFTEQVVTAIIQDTANKTAGKFAAEIIEHIHNLMRDTAGEVDRINRTLNLHELVLNTIKGADRNG
jgi:ribonucleotide reductase beta subunit family protein with ferritin-like domain